MSAPDDDKITPEKTYQDRRLFLKNAAFFAGTAGAMAAGLYVFTGRGRKKPNRPVVLAADGSDAGAAPKTGLVIAKKGEFLVPDETTTSEDDITSYNNFYEFGTSKDAPARAKKTLRTRPWTVEVAGECNKPKTFDLDALLRDFPLEERVYRFRCVEAWSMVIPWLGFPLASLLKAVEPNSNARYVAFTTLNDPEQMPGQDSSVLDWPYVEGLRIDEAMHPLTLLAAGLYGKELPQQNGAPLRLVVPWKYGFKGIKSIVKIELTKSQPKTTWSDAGPSEYGFFANVNPDVAHPRWSQASERRIGEFSRRKTLPFNGYAEQVASLYSGMDPKSLY